MLCTINVKTIHWDWWSLICWLSARFYSRSLKSRSRWQSVLVSTLFMSRVWFRETKLWYKRAWKVFKQLPCLILTAWKIWSRFGACCSSYALSIFNDIWPHHFVLNFWSSSKCYIVAGWKIAVSVRASQSCIGYLCWSCKTCTWGPRATPQSGRVSGLPQRLHQGWRVRYSLIMACMNTIQEVSGCKKN